MRQDFRCAQVACFIGFKRFPSDGIGRKRDDWYVFIAGLFAANAAREFVTVHFRHMQIGEHKGVLSMGQPQLQGLDAIVGEVCLHPNVGQLLGDHSLTGSIRGGWRPTFRPTERGSRHKNARLCMALQYQAGDPSLIGVSVRFVKYVKLSHRLISRRTWIMRTMDPRSAIMIGRFQWRIR